jgi:TP901 family phage tail tape measure protein
MVNEKANIKVTLNSQEAQRQLEQLQDEMKRLIALKKKAEEAGDVSGYKKIDSELKKVTRQATNLVKENQSIAATLKNINGASLKEISDAARIATLQFKTMRQTDAGYKEKASEVTLLNNKVRELTNLTRSQQTATQRMAGIAKTLLPAFSFALIIRGINRVIRSADSLFLNFQERVSNLSALTGLTGSDLDSLAQSAKDLSTTTLEGGIIIDKSAQDIVDGFTKMGSARPELLKNKEALVDVTKSALILAKASKIDMVESVNAVAAAMNQFQEPASEVNRIINEIAAGSLAGSAVVADLTGSLKTSGTVAADSNLSLGQTIAAYETLAERQLKGEEAGTQFKSTLISLKAAGLGYTSGIFNMRDALVELRAKMDEQNTAQARDNVLIDIFGKRNITVATILATSIDRYDHFTKAVVGSNTAIEQASKNSDNEASRRAQAQNKLNILYLEFGEKIAPLLTKGITSGVQLLNIIVKYRTPLLAIVTATAAYVAVTKLKVFWDVAQKGATILAAGAQALFTGNLTRATAAMRLFNTVTKLNPFVLIASLIAAAGVALFAYTKRVKETTAAQKTLLDVEVDAQKSVVEQKLRVEELMSVAKNEKRTLTERQKALEELNKISPKYFGNLKLETLNSKLAKEATDAYTESLLQQARVEAAREKLIELEKERIDAARTGSDYQVKWYQTAFNGVKSFGNVSAFAMNQAATGAKNATKAEADYLKQREALVGIIGKTADTGGDSAEFKKNQELIKAKELELEAAKKMPAATDAEIEARNKKIEAINLEIKALKQLAMSSDAPKDLIKAKEYELEMAKEMPGTTKAEITARNQKIESIEREIAALKELGTSKQGKSGKKEDDEEIKKHIAELEAGYAEEQSLTKKNYLEGKISEDQYNDNLLQSELKFYADKLKIYKVGSKEYQETINKALELEVQADKVIKDLLLKAEKELADAKITNISDEFERQTAVESQRWDNEKASLEKRLIDKQNLSEEEIKFNDTIYRIIEQKEAGHQQNMDNLKSGKNIADLSNLVEAATPVDPNFVTPEEQQALFDARTALIEAQYEKEKQLAGNNKAELMAADKKYQKESYKIKSDQIDAEYALTETRIGAAQSYVSMLAAVVDEESALGKALFLFNQALAVAEVWVNIAKANAKATAALVLPPLYAPIIAANTAQGVIQTGIILAQTVAKFSKSGKKVKAMAEGKYPVQADDGKTYDAQFAGKPKTGFYDGPQLGIFNEVPGQQEMVVDGITTREIRLNYPEIMRSIYAIRDGRTPKYAEGKYPDNTPSAPQQNSNTASQPITTYTIDVDKFDKAIDRLMQMELNLNITEVKKRLDRLEDRNKKTRLP